MRREQQVARGGVSQPPPPPVSRRLPWLAEMRARREHGGSDRGWCVGPHGDGRRKATGLPTRTSRPDGANCRAVAAVGRGQMGGDHSGGAGGTAGRSAALRDRLRRLCVVGWNVGGLPAQRLAIQRCSSCSSSRGPSGPLLAARRPVGHPGHFLLLVVPWAIRATSSCSSSRGPSGPLLAVRRPVGHPGHFEQER